MLFSKGKTNRFIVFSSYGLMSHTVTNEHSVTFSCNPLCHTDGSAMVFEGKDLADSHKTDFYNKVAEVQYVSKVEREFPII